MAKITKKQYQVEQKEINNQIEALQKVLNGLPLETENLPQEIINHIGDTWNATHDKIAELERELYFLDQRWSRRNWTHSEYMQNELITNNID